MTMRIILVDSRPERREVLVPILAAEGINLVGCVSPNEDLLQAVSRYRPDVILIDMDSPDRDTLESLRCVQVYQPRPIVLFTQDDKGQSIRDAVKAGVTAYIVDGLERRRVRPILEVAMARFTQFRELEEELARMRSKLEDRKVIERAKGIIMDQQRVSESDAYQAMRKLAMSKNKKLSEIAEGIITAAELLQT